MLKRGVYGVAEDPGSMAIVVVDKDFNTIDTWFRSDMCQNFPVVVLFDDLAIFDEAYMRAKG